LTVSTNSVTLPATANNNKTFDIVSNTNWNAVCNQNWLIISSSSGSGNITITITATANPTTSARSATVTVSGTGVTDQIVTLTQIGVEPNLAVSVNTLSLASAANSAKTFDITSNTNWIASSNQSWLILSSSSGSGNAAITLTATANPTTAPRTATLTVSGTGVTAQTITVTQDGLIPVLTVSANALAIALSANSTKTFDITSNTNWIVASNQSWLTVSASIGSGNATITLTAAANLNAPPRIATVTISGTGVTAQTITVAQDGVLPALMVSANALSIAVSANSTKTFDIISNTNWIAASNQSWLTLSSSTGSGNATITLTATANPTAPTRIATVTVSGTGVTAQTITVTQAGWTTDISNVTEKESLLYPNPTTNILYFSDKADKINILIFDVTGKLVLSKQITDNQINVGNLQNGIYTIKIENAKGMVVRKFVKQ
jgi:hypothetical protein